MSRLKPSCRMLLLLLSLAFSLPNPSQAELPGCHGETRPLRPGQLAERPIQGTETHCWSIHLEADQFIHVTLEQRGLDMVLALRDPAGQEVAKSDSHANNTGPEDLYTITSVAGTHHIVIVPFPEQDEKVTYRLRAATPRHPTNQDRNRSSTERSFHALGLEMQAVLDSTELPPRQALRHLELSHLRLLTAYEELGDNARQGECQSRLAEILAATLGRRNQVYLLEDRLASSLADPEASTRNATELRRRIRQNLEGAYSKFDTAGRDFQKAYALRDLLLFLTETLELHHEAIPLHHILMNLWEELNIDHQRATQAGNLAQSYLAAGYHSQASSYAHISQNLWERLDSPLDLAASLTIRGRILTRVGRPQQALASLERAVSIYRKEKDLSGAALALAITAYALRTSDLDKEAYSKQRESLQLSIKAKDPKAKQYVLAEFGTTLDELELHDKATQHYEEAVAIYRAANDLKGYAAALCNLAHNYRHLGRYAEALDHYEASLQIFNHLEDPSWRASANLGIAQTKLALNAYKESLQHARVAQQIAEGMHDDFHDPIQRSEFLSSRRKYTDFLLHALWELHKSSAGSGYLEQALELSESIRSRALIQSVSDSLPAISKAEVGILRGLEKIEKERLQRALAGNSASSESLDTRYSALINQLHILQERRHENNNNQHTYLTQTSLKEIREELLKLEAQMISFYLGDESSYAFYLSQETIEAIKLPKRTEIERLIEQALPYWHSTNRRERSRARDDAHALSKTLLSGLADFMGNKRLAIVADGKLNSIPFASLPSISSQEPDSRNNASRALIEEHTIIQIPSTIATKILRERSRNRTKPDHTIAIIADPVFGSSDPRLSAAPGTGSSQERPRIYQRLPGTALEAKRIQALTSEGRVRLITGLDASLETLKKPETLATRHLHIATHGDIAPTSWGAGRLILSLVDKDGQAIDGFLNTEEIISLPIQSDLVVLSGCKTGLGRHVRSEGFIGLVHAFLAAGASTVLASLWQTDDAFTPVFMEEFYRRLWEEDLDPSRALSESQLFFASSERWSSPRFWASFSLQGLPSYHFGSD